MSRFPIAALLLLAGCGDRINPSVQQVADPSLPSQESWRSTVYFTDSARIKAVLWAGHIADFQNLRITLLDDSVHVDFFDGQGRHTSLLTARRGKVNDATQDFVAYDDVVVVSDSGSTMKTDSLVWTNADRTIHTNAFVDITSPAEHIMGQGLVSDQDLKNYRIFRVTGQALKHE
ncbi:MAG TPA: LPS export ABC transporter periplasmic protein LptC [Bacteroidota bacterium]|nr:LPS export ABC transporter periplasmic protein LptC [Bacteroidota bacterium]